MELLMGDEDLARKIQDCFLTDIPQQIRSLKRFIETGNASEAERQAHTIKGASANIDGERLRAVAFEIEKAARTGDLTAAAARTKELEGEFEQLRRVMDGGHR